MVCLITLRNPVVHNLALKSIPCLETDHSPAFLAVNGNMHAAKMVLERFLPPRKDRLIRLDLPEIKNTRDILVASNAIIAAVCRGEISPNYPKFNR